MNFDLLDRTANEYAALGGPESKVPFRAGALWYENEMVRQGLLIRLIGGPADGKVMPKPIGEFVTFRQTKTDGSQIDTTYVVGPDGSWLFQKTETTGATQ